MAIRDDLDSPDLCADWVPDLSDPLPPHLADLNSHDQQVLNAPVAKTEG